MRRRACGGCAHGRVDTRCACAYARLCPCVGPWALFCCTRFIDVRPLTYAPCDSCALRLPPPPAHSAASSMERLSRLGEVPTHVPSPSPSLPSAPAIGSRQAGVEALKAAQAAQATQLSEAQAELLAEKARGERMREALAHRGYCCLCVRVGGWVVGWSVCVWFDITCGRWVWDPCEIWCQSRWVVKCICGVVVLQLSPDPQSRG